MAHSTADQEDRLLISFIGTMRLALITNRESKEVWTDIPTKVLIDELLANQKKMVNAHNRFDSDEVKKRCANIANFAAMIAERCSG